MSVDADTSSAGRPRVVLGVTGGIACYKACTVARKLTEVGVLVDVVLTTSATEFIKPLTFEALTGRRVLTSLWEPGAALDHVRWAREPDAIVIAPATANILARAAQGLADDLLSTLLLASKRPVLAAPAMNDDMWDHPATRANVRTLEQRGWRLLGPASGPLAEGNSSRPGRMVEPHEVVVESLRLIRSLDGAWKGRRVMVTAGPTREAVDPVRVVTNRSSGKMGYALAEAAYARGADVVLISGPSALPDPWGIELIRVESTDDMKNAVSRWLPESDVVVMAAAPADFRPTSSNSQKLGRKDGSLSLTFEPTPDILSSTRSERKKGAVIVGFALETDEGFDRPRRKLQEKDLDLIALNVVSDSNVPFESDDNRVTLISRNGMTEVPFGPKRQVAEAILDAIEQLF